MMSGGIRSDPSWTRIGSKFESSPIRVEPKSIHGTLLFCRYGVRDTTSQPDHLTYSTRCRDPVEQQHSESYMPGVR